jgi:hypothetical protein
MFFLADEMFKQRGKTIQFTFGQPILPTTFNKTKNVYEWAQTLKRFIYMLKENPKAVFEK